MAAEGPGQWEQEVVRLGDDLGLTVLRDFTSNGQVVFATGGGEVTAVVYKARTPDEVLENVAVYLVQKLADGWRAGEPYELLDEYTVMVDDVHWGRRIEPARYEGSPYIVTFVMGYRVRGRILADGEPVEGANVSLEGVCDGVGGQATFWDSQEFNELIWSDTYETYVEGPTVYAPIMTDAEGRWSFVLPKGHGAIYQRPGDRRDDTEQTAQEALPRSLTGLSMVYHGRRAALTEEVEAVIDVLSGKLQVSGEPGAWVKVGSLDEAGMNYLVPQGGSFLIEGLPSGEHNVVQFKLDVYGWDSSWGGPRQIVTVTEGATASVDMGALEWFDPTNDKIAGRVYERPGVPAVGMPIHLINYETGEVLEPVTSTDGGGYWEVTIPEEGLGGDPWIYDGKWGCMPLLGFPYSDVVLGARAYAGFAEMYKPEAWRKGERGHANFQYVQDALWVEDPATGEVFGTVEAAHGGWVTADTLPKFKFVSDVEELIATGPQLRVYRLLSPGEVVMNELYLESQNFEEYETLPGQYRAAGVYPEAKFLIGGKIHGGVVTGNKGAIGLTLPEAYRIGLEFGQHEWYTQVTVEAGRRMACFSDLVCPYCGGPTWRDPSAYGFVRGYCWQCAIMFGDGGAMDGRTHLRTPTVKPSPPAPLSLRSRASAWERGGTALTALVVPRSGGSREYPVRFHWRPDLYDENDEYLAWGGLGQATNAPRWFARHVNEVGDGSGFGRFDAGASPSFQAGHDLAWFGALPEVQRDLGLTQMKLVFDTGYSQAEEVTVELDCRRGDGSIETVRVVIPAGTEGPNEEKAVSDVLPIKTVGKWTAEKRQAPYKGPGLYTAVTGARVVEPVGAACAFAVVNDVGLLASASGIPVEKRKSTPVALQLGVTNPSGPHLTDDAVGQVFMFYAREGEIWMRRRAGLPGDWQEAKQITTDGDNTEPCAEKDDAGRLRAFWQHGGDVVSAVSVDDGGEWLSG
ncbi:MAG: hypothetical protein KKI08_26120 [Armatimonadetes bacterium]|nr:hypothetical protein [Armatimonadota bacterium]